MKKRIIKLSIFILIFILILGTGIVIDTKDVQADSGFDTSYDSSSSWDSGYSSSWDSDYSSSWDNDYLSSWDNDYSSSRSHDYFSASATTGSMILYFISMVFVGIVCICLRSSPKQEIINFETDNLVLVEKNQQQAVMKLKTLIPNFNLEEFLNARYNDFIDIQKAWSDFDYETLRAKLTDELYNQYVMQLDTLKTKHQKNVMSDFEYIKAHITKVTENHAQIIVETELHTSFIDYIEKNNRIVRGNKHYKLKMHYKLVFICDKTNSNINNCPNCGAKIKETSSQICPYCKSLIKTKATGWRLSKKSVITQK